LKNRYKCQEKFIYDSSINGLCQVLIEIIKYFVIFQICKQYQMKIRASSTDLMNLKTIDFVVI